MKTLLTKLSLLSLVLMMGLASCTEEDGITPGANTVAGLSATAVSATAVNVRWTGGSATDTLVATAGGNANTYTGVTTEVIDGTTYYKAQATGLTIGTDYSFTVRNSSGTSANSVTWSPATRWPANGSTVRLYSTAAPAAIGPSGLIIENSGISAVSTIGAEKDRIDVVLGWNDDPAKPVALLSPGVNGSGVFNGFETKFAAEPIGPSLVKGGLDADYYTASLAGQFSTANPNAVNIETLNSAKAAENYSLIVPFRSTAGGEVHYGRIELIPQAGTGQNYGVIVSGGKQYEFVDVRVSYQTVPNSGYVGRPQAPGNFARRAAGAPTVKN